MSTAQTDIVGPAGSGAFGTVVAALSNGNIVVTDPNYSIPAGPTNVGAVYLYDANDRHLISMVTGSTTGDQVGNGGIVVLTNGNFVIRSPSWGAAGVGAVTLFNASTGVNGIVSAANSLVGGSSNDVIGTGVTALANGNYVVRSPNWDNPAGSITDAGAVTWGSGTTGVTGLVSSSNSLVGGTASDLIGSGGVTALSNGNYVVRSSGWDNPAGPIVNAGAVTWGGGTTGITGLVTAANSLVGGTGSDGVGTAVFALSNGNYVVQSTLWDNPSGPITNAGAATWGNGTTGVSGLVTASNSLVGSSANDFSGGLVKLLANGNFVLVNPNWDNPSGPVTNVGAVTFGNGTAGISGPITSSNSLVGGTTSDQVGSVGVTALANGNYVVQSTVWDNPSGPVINVGAATWGSGTTGVKGLVSSSNSLIGSTASDGIGTSVLALSNGNYVVLSPNWDNPSGPVANVGAATWGNGTSGITGLVTVSNSLVGGTANDSVGAFQPAALTNGNYVIASPSWDNPTGPVVDVGAATWVNGSTGITGLVTSSNSLIGGRPSDQVGFDGVTPLTNGNYVVQSRFWDNPAGPVIDVGAVTWGNGANGTTGLVTTSNSLVGGTASDGVGTGGAVTALSNGNYVVSTLGWDNPAGPTTDVGALTWGNGSTGISGPVTASNSLVGSTSGDVIPDHGIVTLTNGNYLAWSTKWDNPNGSITDAGAIALGDGTRTMAGPITDGTVGNGNSVVGKVTNGITTLSFDTARNLLIVGRAASNAVSLLSFATTATSDGNIDNPAIWSNGLPNGAVNAVIPAGRNVTLNGISHVGLVWVNCGGTLSGASSSNYVVGGVRKDYCGATNEIFAYPVGDETHYSPVTTSNVNGTGSLRASVTDDFLAGLQKATSVSRFWSLTGFGITADVSFTYLDADVNGSEANYQVFKQSGGILSPVPSTNNAVTNTATVTGISTFSDWGIGSNGTLAPTAADVSVAGRVLNASRSGVRGARVTIADSRGNILTAITNAFGYYSFSSVPSGDTYIGSVAARGMVFGPRVLQVNDAVAEFDFTPQ